VQAREAAELAVLRGQSAQRSWFFIQRARIGAVHANVSIALTSSILAARAGGEPAAPPPGAPAPAQGGGAPGGAGSGAPAAGAGLFSRLIGASGFQLVRGPTLPYPCSWCAAGLRAGRRIDSALLPQAAVGARCLSWPLLCV